MMLLALSILAGDIVRLKFLPDGMMTHVGMFTPEPIPLVREAPQGLKKEPRGLHSAFYGVTEIQHKPVIVILDRPQGADWQLYVDANSNGDLTDDPRPTGWKKRMLQPRNGGDSYVSYGGFVQIPVKIDGQAAMAQFGISGSDPDAAPNQGIPDQLYLRGDYVRQGQLQLSGRSYNFFMTDRTAKLDFSGKSTAPFAMQATAMLFIDRNGNGKLDSGEVYSTDKPFNIGGVTYEIRNVAEDGGSLELVKSAKTVAEIPLPTEHRAGERAIPFAANLTDGGKVSFPGAYKGKLVLLDFWATWCPPCMGEMPNVVAAYKKFHGQGFEILGISLDNVDSAKDLVSVTKKTGMTWSQVCDQKYWDAAVAKLYSIRSIPASLLVDGDTGLVVAAGEQLRGPNLEKTLQAALAGHRPPPPPPAAETVHFKFMPKGMMNQLGFVALQKAPFMDVEPKGIKKKPEGLKKPSYAILMIQHKAVMVIVDRAEDSEWKVYVDANANADLTDDDPPTGWRRSMTAAPNGEQYPTYFGDVMVKAQIDGQAVSVDVGIGCFDPRDSRFQGDNDYLTYSSDYGWKGTLQLGDKSYMAYLMDCGAKLDFTAKSSEEGGIQLLIDRDGNNRINPADEIWEADKPFNIGGVSYEIKNMAGDGSSFDVVKSAISVEAHPEIVNLSAGKKALEFKATTTKKRKVSFPGDYKGKLVLLDFWATWCGPCMKEMPNVVAAYKKFHGQGFEILGISLDDKDSARKIPSVTKGAGMTWAQVCDQGYWNAAVAKLYTIHSIPMGVLVDGDTGAIIASGEELRGGGLARALEAALAKKK